MAYHSNLNQPPASKHGEYAAPRRRRGSVSGLLTFAVIVVAVIFAMSVFFRVRDIRVEGNEHYTDQEIISAIDLEIGDNLFFYDRFAAISRVFAKLPYIEQVSVERQLPNRITVTVVESKALAYISLGDEEWTIDRGCKVLGKATESELSGLVPIYGISPGTLMIGEKLTTSDGDEALVAFIAEVLFNLQERGLSDLCTRLDFTDLSKVNFSYGGKYTVILGSSSEIEHKFNMLVSVMSKLKEGDSGVIDISDGRTAHFMPT